MTKKEATAGTMEMQSGSINPVKPFASYLVNTEEEKLPLYVKCHEPTCDVNCCYINKVELNYHGK